MRVLGGTREDLIAENETHPLVLENIGIEDGASSGTTAPTPARPYRGDHRSPRKSVSSFIDSESHASYQLAPRRDEVQRARGGSCRKRSKSG